MRRRVLILPFLLAVAMLAGCQGYWRDPPRACPPAAMAIPPAGIPDGPPPIAPVPRVDAPPPANNELLLPQNPPGKSRSQYRTTIPPARRGAALGDPDYVERPKIDEIDEPKAKAEKPKAAEAPAGIPDFSEVKDGVSTGQRPTIDGLDWLKSKGYKTIVYIHSPSEIDTTDRRQIELRDMKYVSLVVTPATLTKEWMDEFNRVVGDSGKQPIFVYGDPATIGPVWYLHLRMVDFLTHDEARVQAGRYGLKDEKSDMFSAAVKVLPPSK